MVIILGAGRPFRGETPSALTPTLGNQRVLDWIMDAFNKVIPAEFHFVGGYRLETVVKSYPQIHFSVNPNWRTTGSLGSLMTAPLSPDKATYVCYADVVFTSESVDLLRAADGDAVLVVDRTWRDRYEYRTRDDLVAAEKVYSDDGRVVAIGAGLPVDDADAEFTGLLKLSSRAVQHLLALREQDPGRLLAGSIPDLIHDMQMAGLDVRCVETQGQWAELNAPQDLARFVFGTKAETLDRLRPLVQKSIIGEQIRFTVQQWLCDRVDILDRIRFQFGNQALAVRSSALTEDGWIRSNAGAFLSVVGIPGAEPEQVAAAIDKVVDSYGDHNPAHQVLVQAMVTNVAMIGVALTRTLSYGAPYYTFNYDDTTSDTHSVTGGGGQNLKTVVVHRDNGWLRTDLDPRLLRVLTSVQELEELVGHDSLDVEFAVTTSDEVHILQLRPIAVQHGHRQVSDKEIKQALQVAEETFHQRQHKGPFILGRRTYFGVMPDWNPAEIIGTKPRRLAMTLYQYLVTNEVWAKQRADYGYRDVRPHQLLVSFAGHPYVDVRADFNSFIPADLSDELAERLVDHYLDWLEARPHLHDKVEFEVVFSSLTFDFDQKATRLLQNGFTIAEVNSLRQGLMRITRHALERYHLDLEQIHILGDRYERLTSCTLSPLDRAYALLEDCRRYGTLPFAHLARSAFIAVSLLRSLETIGITSANDTMSFLNSLQTVARTFELDGLAVAAGKLAWDTFVARYGHLRPGTYEITSPIYSKDPDRFLKPMIRRDTAPSNTPNFYIWDAKIQDAVARELRRLELPDDPQAFAAFLRRAIEGREYAKFVFTRNLSVALEALAQFATSYGVTREELSDVSIQDILSLRVDKPPTDIGAWLKARSEEGADWYRRTRALELPPLLLRAHDLYAFARSQTQPNYVTQSCVVADAIDLSRQTPQNSRLKGKIVLIPRADPGYDWLFGHDIAGLVTMYGGANSHMTIRAAEFGLPAAIGVGESLYEQLSHAEVIELDCAAQRIRVVR